MVARPILRASASTSATTAAAGDLARLAPHQQIPFAVAPSAKVEGLAQVHLPDMASIEPVYTQATLIVRCRVPEVGFEAEWVGGRDVGRHIRQRLSLSMRLLEDCWGSRTSAHLATIGPLQPDFDSGRCKGRRGSSRFEARGKGLRAFEQQQQPNARRAHETNGTRLPACSPTCRTRTPRGPTTRSTTPSRSSSRARPTRPSPARRLTSAEVLPVQLPPPRNPQDPL